MNILIIACVAALAFCVLWSGQSVALLVAGEPLAWPLRYTTRKPIVRWTGRMMIHVSWLIILIGTPLALGISPLEALRQAFPLPVPWRPIGIAFAIMLIICGGMFIVYNNTGWLHLEPQLDPKVRRAKLLRRFIGPLPLATLEEGVFRGIVFEQMLRSLPQTPFYTAVAVILSSVVFTAAHFIKGAPGKAMAQKLQEAYGYFIVGCLFAWAYLVGGRSLWLPIVVHASAIFFVEVTRLYAVPKAPRWLVGLDVSPQSGLIGTLAVLGMAIALAVLI